MYNYNIITNNNNGDDMYLINNFFIFSIMGHIFESIMFIFLNSNNNSGILIGPITPVYGFGIVLIILINKIIDKFNLNIIAKIIISFLLYTIILSFIEFIGGVIIEKLFNKVFWDYTNHKFNWGHYISLEMALLWGIVSSLYLFVFKRLFDKLIKKIPNYVTYFFMILFLSDLIATLIIKLK